LPRLFCHLQSWNSVNKPVLSAFKNYKTGKNFLVPHSPTNINIKARDGSHRDNFGESLKTLSAVTGFFLGYIFLNQKDQPMDFFGAQGTVL
jgi:hypothetical protein